MASASYNQTPSSSTPTSWDVFLSFRGLDTRYTFTDHLYKALDRTGIRTFRDDPELLSGEVISRALPQAIQESKTYIVVLSENYASSSWCLEELVEMFDCYKRMNRLVIPVFYYVDPSVVRHQKGSFIEAFEKHQTRYDADKVSKWRLTLKEVAGFSGYHISQDRSQADIIDKVVNRVLREINPMTMDVAKYPVGLASRVRSVTALLKSDTEGVIRIGIHGMGGVGKTTLAKAVYNQNYQRFQGSCFLANVREVSRTEQGLVCLQKQLIVDVLKLDNINVGNVDQGIELVRARICSRKVLIVIDDLDDPKPLEAFEGSFGLGSIIVITTRNEDLLDSIKVQAKYKVNELDDDQSSQLFAYHAFGDNKVPNTFTEMFKEIQERAAGLPLALKVFGSNLLNQPEEEWRWFIDKLNRVPVNDIEKKLVISFDALKLVDPMVQDIFLDIACFYIGWKKAKVVEIMETCYTFVNRNIDILKKRCLLTINDRDEFGMHDLIQEMGRGIARNNSPGEPGKHRRLWLLKDIYSVLKKHKGTEAIEGIISTNIRHSNTFMEGAREVSFAAETFRRMSKLRFLRLDNVNLTGTFEQTFDDLRWLQWNNCPLKCLPFEFHPQKLVTLELPQSELTTMWELNMDSQIFKSLKTLNMTNSPNLISTPDFTKLPCLETLNLNCCVSLEEVHISIGSLVRLVYLDLGGCSNLKSLPDSICSLRALNVLIVSRCSSLKALPIELGNIESLKVLHVMQLTVSKLPDSIGRLSNLVELGIFESRNLAILPDSICNLRSLEILDIRFCERLVILPDQLGNITSLRGLHARDATLLKFLPDMNLLSNIEHLDLSGCSHLLSIAELPPNLVKLQAEGCTSIKRLPNLAYLRKLSALYLKNCSSLVEILGLVELTSLKDLNVSNCGNLLSIPELGPNLELISASGCTSIKRLPNLTYMRQLRVLNLESCSDLTEIIGLEELTSLEDINIGDCGNLLSIPELAPNLKCIIARGCKFIERLPNLSNLKQLEKLHLQSCTALTEILGLQELASLENLNVSSCVNLLSVPEFASNLKIFRANGCTSLKRLPNILNLKQLKILELANCSALTEIRGLEELTSLIDLNLNHCGDFLSIPELPPNLTEIHAQSCMSMESLPNLSNLKQLSSLNLRHCYALTEILGLQELTSLEHLFISGCGNLLSIPELAPNLQIFEAIGCTSLKRLPNLSNMKQLKILDLSTCIALTEILGLQELTSLEALRVGGCHNLLSLPEFCPNLELISISGCTSVKRLPNVTYLRRLSVLKLKNCCDLTEIIGLEELTSLEDINISGCGNLLSVPELAPNLKCIMARGCKSIERLPNLSNLKQLEKLHLQGCGALTEILGLEEITSLKDLNLSNCGNLVFVPKLPLNLKILRASGCTSVERLPNLSKLKQLKMLDLASCSCLTEIPGLEELNLLLVLVLTGCHSSLLAYTLTKPSFQVFSGFDHDLKIYISPTEFPDWISHLSILGGATMCLDFLALIVCSKLHGGRIDNIIKYSVKNTASNFMWSDRLSFSYSSNPFIHIIPISVTLFKDGVDRIELTSNRNIFSGIHLLYKTEITNRRKYDSTNVNVEDERSNPLDSDKGSNKNWLSLGSTTVNAEEDSNPSKRLKRSEFDNWLSL